MNVMITTTSSTEDQDFSSALVVVPEIGEGDKVRPQQKGLSVQGLGVRGTMSRGSNNLDMRHYWGIVCLHYSAAPRPQRSEPLS